MSGQPAIARGTAGVDRPDFTILTQWHLDATPDELSAIALTPELLHVWCPRVFLTSEMVERGAADGLGMVVRLHSKGLLPHSFFFVAEVVDVIPERYMRLQVTGDFDGFGDLYVEPDPDGGCRARLVWTVNIGHPYVRYFMRILHPVFVWNHKWAVRWARKLMQAEVHRRRVGTHQFTRKGATFPHNLPFVRAWQVRRSARRGWS
ncbi:SRPBCC family protein [Pelagibacterium halotolerans]|uniref:SRPBCC family protein n=1 Tax=Pelagibacterium halotolerans TaxID=531813 RepID=UPI00384BF1E3